MASTSTSTPIDVAKPLPGIPLCSPSDEDFPSLAGRLPLPTPATASIRENPLGHKPQSLTDEGISSLTGPPPSPATAHSCHNLLSRMPFSPADEGISSLTGLVSLPRTVRSRSIPPCRKAPTGQLPSAPAPSEHTSTPLSVITKSGALAQSSTDGTCIVDIPSLASSPVIELDLPTFPEPIHTYNRTLPTVAFFTPSTPANAPPFGEQPSKWRTLLQSVVSFGGLCASSSFTKSEPWTHLSPRSLPEHTHSFHAINSERTFLPIDMSQPRSPVQVQSDATLPDELPPEQYPLQLTVRQRCSCAHYVVIRRPDEFVARGARVTIVNGDDDKLVAHAIISYIRAMETGWVEFIAVSEKDIDKKDPAVFYLHVRSQWSATYGAWRLMKLFCGGSKSISRSSDTRLEA